MEKRVGKQKTRVHSLFSAGSARTLKCTCHRNFRVGVGAKSGGDEEGVQGEVIYGSLLRSLNYIEIEGFSLCIFIRIGNLKSRRFKVV